MSKKDHLEESIENRDREAAGVSKNVFLDLGFSKEEAAGLKLRSYLFIALQEVMRQSGMNQTELASRIKADQPKVSKILNRN